MRGVRWGGGREGRGDGRHVGSFRCRHLLCGDGSEDNGCDDEGCDDMYLELVGGVAFSCSSVPP